MSKRALHQVGTSRQSFRQAGRGVKHGLRGIKAGVALTVAAQFIPGFRSVMPEQFFIKLQGQTLQQAEYVLIGKLPGQSVQGSSRRLASTREPTAWKAVNMSSLSSVPEVSAAFFQASAIRADSRARPPRRRAAPSGVRIYPRVAEFGVKSIPARRIFSRAYVFGKIVERVFQLGKIDLPTNHRLAQSRGPARPVTAFSRACVRASFKAWST